MTRIWLLSDLHTETAGFTLPATPAGAEVLVVAGDVSENWGWSLNTLIRWQIDSGLPVIFVPGNHDFYGADLSQFHGDPWMIERFAAQGLHILHDGQTVVIGGTRFVGATLWTDFQISDDMFAAFGWFKANMPDRRAIDVGRRRVTGGDLRREHRQQLVAIEHVLAQPFDGPTVVVTHHAPHKSSLSDPISIDESDAAFASDLTSTIERYRPHAWLHGHVHGTCDYVVHDTWIVCNPPGYVTPTSQGNPLFNPELVINVC